MGGRGNAGTRSSGSTADYSNYKKWENTQGYRSAEELREAGFKALNDFSLSSLLKPTNEVAMDNQPWNNKVVYFIWDPDFKSWQRAAERSY